MMNRSELLEIKERIESVEQQIEQDETEGLDEKVLAIQEDLAYYADPDGDTALWNKLHRRVQDLKDELEIMDPDTELDRMFPNRHDEDFDEDSMSYDSVFGDD